MKEGRVSRDVFRIRRKLAHEIKITKSHLCPIADHL